MDIKPYLKYYIGCDVQLAEADARLVAVGILGNEDLQIKVLIHGQSVVNIVPIKSIKPILRRISSLTEEEKINILGDDTKFDILTDAHHYSFTPNEFHALVNVGIWMWDNMAFEDGSIIDKDNYLPNK